MKKVQNKVMSFLGLAGDELPDSSKSIMESIDAPQAENVVHLKSVKQRSNIVFSKVEDYEQVYELADHLCDGKAVIVLLDLLDDHDKQRMIDFLHGIVYALNGQIRQVAEHTWLYSIEDFEPEGSLLDLLPKEFQSKMR